MLDTWTNEGSPIIRKHTKRDQLIATGRCDGLTVDLGGSDSSVAARRFCLPGAYSAKRQLEQRGSLRHRQSDRMLFQTLPEGVVVEEDFLKMAYLHLPLMLPCFPLLLL